MFLVAVSHFPCVIFWQAALVSQPPTLVCVSLCVALGGGVRLRGPVVFARMSLNTHTKYGNVTLMKNEECSHNINHVLLSCLDLLHHMFVCWPILYKKGLHLLQQQFPSNYHAKCHFHWVWKWEIFRLNILLANSLQRRIRAPTWNVFEFWTLTHS